MNQLILYKNKPNNTLPTLIYVNLFLIILGYLIARKLIKIPNFNEKKTSVKTSARKLKRALGVNIKATLKMLDTVALVLLMVLAPFVLIELSGRYLLPNIISKQAIPVAITPNKYLEYQQLSKLYSFSLVYYIQRKNLEAIDTIIEQSDKTLINLLLQQIEIQMLGGAERFSANTDWGLYNTIYQKYSRACRLRKGDCGRLIFSGGNTQLHADKGGDAKGYKEFQMMMANMKILYV